MEKLLRAGFAALGLPLDETALTRFETYYELLEERSKVMNLTAIHGETDVAQLHFLDSAALLTVEPLAGKSVIDVGTGAGFPGLPLKIAQPTFRSRCSTVWISACVFLAMSAPRPGSRM